MRKEEINVYTLFRRFCEGDYSVINDDRGYDYFIDIERHRLCKFMDEKNAIATTIVVKSKFKYNSAKYIMNSDDCRDVESLLEDCYCISFKLLDNALKRDVKYENVEILDYSSSSIVKRKKVIDIDPEYLTRIIAKADEDGYALVSEDDFIDHTGSFNGKIKLLGGNKTEFVWREHKNKETLIRYGKMFYLMEEVSNSSYWSEGKFITKLPKSVQTIEEAKDLLTPENLRGKLYKRIGNLFFMPTEEDNTRVLSGIIKAEMHKGIPKRTYEIAREYVNKKETVEDVATKLKARGYTWIKTFEEKSRWNNGTVYYSNDPKLPVDVDLQYMEFNQLNRAYFTNLEYTKTSILKNFNLGDVVEGADKGLRFEQAMFNKDGSKIIARKEIKHKSFGKIDLKNLWHLLMIETQEVYTDRDGNESG